MIPVSEIFYTIQGEGRFAGHPAVFVRVGGCNLTCPGFGPNGCDSYFSVDAASFKHEWDTLPAEAIISAINFRIPSYPESRNKPIIVLTGGEPTLYIEQLSGVVTYFATRGYIVQIETNATRMIDFDKFPIYKRVSFAMSVKMACSGEPEHKRINIAAISNILTYSSDSFFKFVCATLDDVQEAEDILKEIPYYADVYLMPMGENKMELYTTAVVVFEQAMKKGFKYSDRLHIRVYNDERGK